MSRQGAPVSFAEALLRLSGNASRSRAETCLKKLAAFSALPLKFTEIASKICFRSSAVQMRKYTLHTVLTLVISDFLEAVYKGRCFSMLP